MTLIPTIVKIEILKHDPNNTLYCWDGYKHYQWLWHTWKRQLYFYKDFNVTNSYLTFNFKVPKYAEISMDYDSEISKRERM